MINGRRSFLQRAIDAGHELTDLERCALQAMDEVHERSRKRLRDAMPTQETLNHRIDSYVDCRKVT